MDKVRAAVFSSLGEVVVGARVLDLFAGSGALGLEALSRGAASAVFVENQPRCVAAVRENAARCRVCAEVVCEDVMRWLRRAVEQWVEGFDLVFADPPYLKEGGRRDWAAELWHEPALGRVLAPQGLWVLETWKGWEAPVEGEWRVFRRRVYGETAVYYIERL